MNLQGERNNPVCNEDMRELLKQGKYLKLLLENSPEIIMMTDAEGRVEYCTHALLRALGLDCSDSIRGMPFTQLYTKIGDAAFVERGRKRFQSVKSGVPTSALDVSIDFPGNDHPRKYNIQTVSLLDEEGVFDGILAFYFDTTEVREAEANESAALMLDAMPFACSLWEEDGSFIDCNQAALRMLELEGKESFPKDPCGFDPERQPDGVKSRERFRRMKNLAFKSGSHRYSWMRLTAAGNELPVETTLASVSWNGKRRLAMFDRDLRQIIAAERRMKKADEKSREMEIQSRSAQAASETKSRFLASMSHEIRTPMNAIIGLSDLMRTDNLDDTQRDYFEDIKRISKQLLRLINDVLDFSKIEAGKMELTPVHFNMLEMFDHISSMSRFLVESKELEFIYSFDLEPPHVFYGDDIRIRQCILNLVNNAIKYTKSGFVDFSVKQVVEQGQNYVAFVVKDSGIGIKKKDLPMLFDAFQRLDSFANREVAGTGLGLSISSMLIKMMGGRIEVKSQYGKGSEFTALIPLQEGDPAHIERSLLKELLVAEDSARALVVDDNPINLKVAAAYLSRHNVRADSAPSGAEALSMIRKNNYDIIFMDHMMPDMDGVETVKRLRRLSGAKYKNVPVIAMTANAIAGAREMFMAAGMNDYLSKPIDPYALNQLVGKWLPQEKLAGVRVERAAAEERAGDSCVLDTAVGLKNAADNKELYEHLVSNFIELHAADKRLIEGAMQEGDLTAARRFAHTLKSNAALLGAERLRKVAFSLETDLRNEDMSNIASLLRRLDVEMAAALDALRKAVPEMMTERLEVKRNWLRKLNVEVTPDYAVEGDRGSAAGGKEADASVRGQKATGKPGAARARKSGDALSRVRANEEARQFIRRLKPLLESGNTESLNMIEGIKKYLGHVGDEGAELSALIWDFEFEKALNTLSTIERGMY
ncbi:MAG: response regulator [Clostridiales Family XIII bacterium]|jgi:signal transduction histidine kinase/DNA-binding response OmpR family regulator|nr:response regulator [Clostridiales Family XIII bacterium]